MVFDFVNILHRLEGLNYGIIMAVINLYSPSPQPFPVKEEGVYTDN
jgi:hypothetical protein